MRVHEAAARKALMHLGMQSELLFTTSEAQHLMCHFGKLTAG